MSLKDGGMTILVGCLIIGLCIGMYGVITSPKSDGPMEEAGEEIIEYATKIDIDLTPSSKENK